MNARMLPLSQGSGGTAFLCPHCGRAWRVMEPMQGQRVCDDCLTGRDDEVTTAMAEAGSAMASALIDAKCCKSMDGLGGGKPWLEWQASNVGKPNHDLAVAYAQGRIDSVTAIYLAMRRSKLSRLTAA